MAVHAPSRLDADTKSLAARERNEEERAAWRQAVAQRDAEQVVCVDESGTHPCVTRRSGGAPHDRRATGAVPRPHGGNLTVVAALTPAGLQTPWLIAGAMDSATGAWSITQPLAPMRRPGPVVVLDKLSAHTAASLRQASEARGGSRLFLPPSSPDCTPIEPAFSTRSRRSCAGWVRARARR